jgi:hypothetical protein
VGYDGTHEYHRVMHLPNGRTAALGYLLEHGIVLMAMRSQNQTKLGVRDVCGNKARDALI